MLVKTLSIDIETFSSVNLSKAGVYKYAASPDFEPLLFAYSVDRGPVHVVDLAQGEKLPAPILAALTDPGVTKWAFNAAFERVCLSSWLYGDGTMLDPAQWRCTMVWASYLGMPMSLDQVGVVLDIERKKIREGQALIRKFCTPSPATLLNTGGNRTLPVEDPEAWGQFKTYNARDVDVEMQIQHRLRHHPVPDAEWAHYVHDQHINDRGIGIDMDFARAAVDCDIEHRQRLTERAIELTGLPNPNSPPQLSGWLEDQGHPLPSLTKTDVETALETASGDVKTVLELRQELSRSSVKKYQAMENCETGGRAHGLLQFYGAGRTGRYAGRLVQVQNLPRNYLPDLDAARDLVKARQFEALELLYPSVSDTLSQLVRTAFTPANGHYFVVADYSAIEARVLAWLAGEQSTLDAFRAGKDLYCETASRMFGLPVEKHGQNAELRQKGKIATLACGYGGSVGALKAMGALRMGLDEHELKPIVDAWRAANPAVVRLWWAVDKAGIYGITVASIGLSSTPKQHTVAPLLILRRRGTPRSSLPTARPHDSSPRCPRRRSGSEPGCQEPRMRAKDRLTRRPLRRSHIPHAKDSRSRCCLARPRTRPQLRRRRARQQRPAHRASPRGNPDTRSPRIAATPACHAAPRGKPRCLRRRLR